MSLRHPPIGVPETEAKHKGPLIIYPSAQGEAAAVNAYAAAVGSAGHINAHSSVHACIAEAGCAGALAAPAALSIQRRERCFLFGMLL